MLVGLIVVVFELQQTRASLEASAHSSRIDRIIDIGNWRIDHGTAEIVDKIERGEEVSSVEFTTVDNMLRNYLRHFEDVHFQRNLGLINDETWEANMRGLDFWVSRPVFGEIIDSAEEIGLRKSFTDLVLELQQ